MIFRSLLFLGMILLNAQAFAAQTFEFPEFVNFEGRFRPLNSMENAVANSLCEKKKCAGLKPAILVQRIREGSADSIEVFRIHRATTVDILHLDPSRRTFKRQEFEPIRSLLRQYAEREDSREQTLELVRLNSALDLYDSIRSESFWKQISVTPQELTSASLRKLNAERAYLNVNLPFFTWILACLAFVFSLLAVWKERLFWKLALGMQSLVALSSVAIFIWRGLAERRLPLTSLYEMLLALVLGISLFAIVLSARLRLRAFFACASGMCLALFLVMRSALSGDSFGSVSMVLDSPFWLSLHVFTIASGFCVLILASLFAHVMLAFRALKKESPAEMPKILFGMLGVGFAISALGTLLGGFWADVAWGRFWGWDPKENGALLVLLWVLIVMHLKAGKLASWKTLEVLSALLSVVIAFCLFGVNLLGVGLHSYGYSPHLLVAFISFVVFDMGMVSALAFLSRNGR